MIFKAGLCEIRAGSPSPTKNTKNPLNFLVQIDRIAYTLIGEK